MSKQINNYLKISLLLFTLSLMSCGQQEPQVKLALSKDHRRVQVSGLSEVDLGGLRRDSMPLQAWQTLLPVYAMPADTDMKDDAPVLPGKYDVANGLISFTPDSAFKSGQVYFARYYRFDQKISTWDIISHKRELGKARYVELKFKY